MVTILSKNEAQTKKIAKLLKQQSLLRPLKTKGALIFGLKGELGSGKTKFVQAFAKALGIRKRITSPTFVLMKQYPIHHKRFDSLYHIDCYRINRPKDLSELETEEIFNNSKNIVFIEWAGKISSILPRDTIWIKFEVIDQTQRKIKISDK